MKKSAIILLSTIVIAVCSSNVIAKSPKTFPANGKLKIFILSGQSNMVGSDSKADDIKRFPPFAGLESMGQPVICALNGDATSAGLELALGSPHKVRQGGPTRPALSGRSSPRRLSI